jgi:polyphosphate glucokinase
MNILGIDVGASGIKGALVSLQKGQLSGERYRVPTPQPSTPHAMAQAFSEIVSFFEYSGPVGCGFPAIVKNGTAHSAANIDKSWIGVNIQEVFSDACGCPVFATNDADAAGMAEMRFGVGKGEKGLVIMITIGTGLGSVLFYNGEMIPNTELGHLIWKNGNIAEHYCSSGARSRLKISRKESARRFNEYLSASRVAFLSRSLHSRRRESKLFEQFKEHLHTRARITPARMLNNAGIIGAASYASESR